MQDYRERMRAKGLRPKQIWLPDTKDPKFIEEYRRQLQALRNDPQEHEIMDELQTFEIDLMRQAE
jgi:Protein  of unknown function (DUF3018)